MDFAILIGLLSALGAYEAYRQRQPKHLAILSACAGACAGIALAIAI